MLCTQYAGLSSSRRVVEPDFSVSRRVLLFLRLLCNYFCAAFVFSCSIFGVFLVWFLLVLLFLATGVVVIGDKESKKGGGRTGAETVSSRFFSRTRMASWAWNSSQFVFCGQPTEYETD